MIEQDTGDMGHLAGSGSARVGSAGGASWSARWIRVRQLDAEMTRRINLFAAGLAGALGVMTMLSWFWRATTSNWQGLFWLGLVAVATTVVFVVLSTSAFDHMQRYAGPIYLGLIMFTTLSVTAGLYLAGPHWTIVSGVYSVALILSFYVATFRMACLTLILIAAEFAAVLVLRPGSAYPVVQWLFLVIIMGSIGGVVGSLMRDVDEVAESERRGRVALAELNADLEFMVDEQVDELSRLGRLRRFLSPQVAEAILESEQSDLTAPHRQLIAVLFTDLRGFTHFSANTQPEDVMEVLDGYYRKAGALFAEMGATIGGFAGDGMMAFFNDPVPHRDPAGAAVELAVRLRDALEADVQTWHRRGYQLDLGMGVAFGYATLGLIGCEGRYDYTALGPVVNLASRLCNAAQPGELLVDDRTHDAVRGRAEVEDFELHIRGLAEPIRVQRVLAWRHLRLAQVDRSA
jgi:class 3 adenylate cyclase